MREMRTSVVDQNVDAAILRHSLAEHLSHLIALPGTRQLFSGGIRRTAGLRATRLGHVAANGERVAALRLNLRHNLVSTRRSCSIVDDDLQKPAGL